MDEESLPRKGAQRPASCKETSAGEVDLAFTQMLSIAPLIVVPLHGPAPQRGSPTQLLLAWDSGLCLPL